MQHTWDEIDQLSDILESEIAGRPVDQDLARRLAAQLAELCPAISASMKRISERMDGRMLHQGTPLRA